MLIEDHARLAFTAMHPDEKKHEAVAFLHSPLAYYAELGVSIKRLLTDNSRFSAHGSLRRPARPWV